MENVVVEIIKEWGAIGVAVVFALFIIIKQIIDWVKGSKPKAPAPSNDIVPAASGDTISELLATMLTSLSDKIDRMDDKVDRLEVNTNNVNNRLTVVETKLNNHPQTFINHLSKMYDEKTEAHNKMMEDQMKLGPELHRILAEYKLKINANHIFLGSFHNGTTNISGIPYCKFDLIAEKFSPDEVERDIEYAFIYKDADILRHDRLPITVLNEGMVHFIIEEDGTSKLSEIDDVIYRRMVGRDIKQLAVHITRDEKGKPSGFVGCTRYDYNDMDLSELKSCARELEIIYKNSSK